MQVVMYGPAAAVLGSVSNCTHLFRPEPNQTRHTIFAFVSLLFSNL